MGQISKTRIDRLGDRLRKRPVEDKDLKALDEYRKSFGEAYENVIRRIKQELDLDASGRPAKSTNSVIGKLQREHVRLSQMQDIAGCRIVVANIDEQDRVIDSIQKVFPTASLVDRRIHPSYGYRAVHVIIKAFDKLIEVQIRTELQHSWAELSEKFSDEIDFDVKYGGGGEKIQGILQVSSNLIEKYEKTEKRVTVHQEYCDNQLLKDMRTQMMNTKKDIVDIINSFRMGEL